MTQLSLLLRSRAFFILLYCLFLGSLAVALVNTFLMRLSVPNLAQNFGPSLVIGTTALGYWLYITRFKGEGVIVSFERPPLSLKLLMPLLLAGSLGAVFVLLAGNQFPSAAGMMISLLYIFGLIGVALLSALKPYLGICALLLALPGALQLHLGLRFQGRSDNFSYVAMNPETVLVLVTSLSVLVGFLARNWRPVRTRLDVPIGIFLLGSIIALFNSSDVLFSSRALFAGTFVPILCYYLVVNGLRSKREAIVVVSVLLFSFFLMGSYSLLAFGRETTTARIVTGEERLTQFFVNPGFFAAMLTLILPLPLCLAALPRIPLKVRFASGLLAALLLTVLVSTYVRGAWLAFAVSVAILLLLSRDIRRLSLRILPVLVMAFFLWRSLILQVFWARTYSIDAFFQSPSWTDRVATWQDAWNMILDNPMVGVGPGMFRGFYLDYMVGYTRQDQVFWTDGESLLLTVWSEAGPLALIGIIGIFAVSLFTGYRLIKNARDPLLKAISLGLFAGLIGFLASTFAHGTLLVHIPMNGQSFFGGHTFYLFIVLGVIVALTRMEADEARNEDTEPHSN